LGAHLGLLEDGQDVLQHLLRLDRDVTLDQLVGGGVDRDLAGDEEQPAGDDALRVGADGGGGVSGGHVLLGQSRSFVVIKLGGTSGAPPTPPAHSAGVNPASLAAVVGCGASGAPPRPPAHFAGVNPASLAAVVGC